MEECTPSNFLSTKTGLAYSSRAIALCSLPIELLTFYCILKKTPEAMRSVKSSLLNLNFWYLFSGMTLSFLMTPFLFNPHPGFFFVGPLTDFGVSTDIQNFLVYLVNLGLLLSILMLYENRSSLIFNIIFRLKSMKPRSIWLAINIVLNIGLTTPMNWNVPDPNKAKLDFMKNFPCPPKELFDEPVIFLAYEGFWVSYIQITSLLLNGAFILQIFLFSSCCIYYLFHAKSCHLSPEIRRLQVRSFYATVIQTVIPMVLVTVPNVMMVGKQDNQVYDQTKNTISYLLLMLHKGIGSLAIIVVHYSYRNFVFGCFKCGKRREVVPYSTDPSNKL